MNGKRQTTRTVDLVSLSSKESCSGPELPVRLKEAQIFEFDDTILLCTSFTQPKKKKLQCFKFVEGEWLSFDTPCTNK